MIIGYLDPWVETSTTSAPDPLRKPAIKSLPVTKTKTPSNLGMKRAPFLSGRTTAPFWHCARSRVSRSIAPLVLPLRAEEEKAQNAILLFPASLSASPARRTANL